MIGGLNQEGDYTIDCRFNKEELARRIRRIRKYRSRIYLHRKDALKFIDHVERTLPLKTFLCIDPPYFHKALASTRVSTCGPITRWSRTKFLNCKRLGY